MEIGGASNRNLGISRGTVLFLALSIALCAAAFYISGSLTRRHIVSAQVVTAPFTLELDMYYLSEDSREVYVGRKILARRSDGTASDSQPVGSYTTGITARQITYLDGRSTACYDPVAAKSTWPRISELMVAPTKARILYPPRDCVFEGEYFLKNDRVLDHSVAVVKSAGGQNVRTTSWRAPNVACAVLQYELEKRRADGSFGLQAWGRPVSLKLGEPDPALFDEGPAYDELKPSDIQKRFLAKLGVAQDDHMRQDADEMDKRYFASTPK